MRAHSFYCPILSIIRHEITKPFHIHKIKMAILTPQKLSTRCLILKFFVSDRLPFDLKELKVHFWNE